MDYSKLPYTSRAAHLERAISHLEGWAFGSWLRFIAISYGDQLHIDLGGWQKIDGFRELPALSAFAADLNAAMKPVIDNYTKKLRQELANECTKIRARAVDADDRA